MEKNKRNNLREDSGCKKYSIYNYRDCTKRRYKFIPNKMIDRKVENGWDKPKEDSNKI